MCTDEFSIRLGEGADIVEYATSLHRCGYRLDILVNLDRSDEDGDW